jgi:hypothetical protein
MFATSSLAQALVGAAGALVVAVVVAWIGYKRYLGEQADQQETLLNALFGELANIYEHYSYAASELPTDTSDAKELRLRLNWSKYGDMQSTQKVSEYGFLSADDIRLVLQLGLRIRNNDILFELLLADFSAIENSDLSIATERMQYAIKTTHELIHALVAKRPRLQPILDAIDIKLAKQRGVR